MLLQATRNPEHLSMSRDSNCTKQIRIREGKTDRRRSICEMRPEVTRLGFELTNSMAIAYPRRSVTNVGQSRRGRVVKGDHEKPFAEKVRTQV
jgi:hypothetical protein